MGDAYTTMKTAMKVAKKPAQVSQPRLPNVRMLAMQMQIMAAMAVNQLVHRACTETALKAVAAPTMQEPETTIQVMIKRAPANSLKMGPPITPAMSATEWQPA